MARNSELLTQHEVAEILQVSLKTLQNWRHSKKLPFVKLGYRSIRFRRSDVEKLIAGGGRGRRS